MRPTARTVTIVTICLAALGAPAGAATPGVRALNLGGRRCDLIAVPMSEPLAGTSSCPGVRPGALVEAGQGSTSFGYCTLNFLFLGSDGARYIGTAGHCVLGTSNGTPVELESNNGEKSWKYGKGPWAKDSNGKIFGYFVYAALQDPKDFALIKIAKGVQSSPSMCIFGTPTGTNTSTSAPVILHHFGNGVGIGDGVPGVIDVPVLPGRTEVAQDMSSPDHVFATGVISPGDSGSGVIDDSGQAVGVIVTFGEHLGDNPTDAGVIGITRLAPQLARAAKVLRLKLRLVTARA